MRIPPQPTAVCPWNRHPLRRAPPRRLAAWLAAWALAGVGAPIIAPTRAVAAPVSRKAIADAEALSKQAVERFKAKDFDAAAELFMRAYELARKPASVFNAARAKEDAGKLAEAKALYELYGRISDSPDGVVDARKRIEAIDAELAARKAAEEERAQKARLEAAAAEERAAAARRAADEQAARAREAEERLRKSEADAKERANAASAAATYAVAVLPPRANEVDAAGQAALQRLVTSSVAEAAAAGLGPVRTPAELQAAIAAGGNANGCDHPCELATATRLGVGWAVTWTAWSDRAGGHVRGALWRLGRDGGGVEAGSIETAGSSVAAAVERVAAWQVGSLYDPARRLTWSPAGSPTADQGGAALLRVESVPSGATLLVDEQPSGQTPRSLRLQAGAHRLRVSVPGHADRAGTITVAAGSAGRTTITLVALPRAPVAEATGPAGRANPTPSLGPQGQPGPQRREEAPTTPPRLHPPATNSVTPQAAPQNGPQAGPATPGPSQTAPVPRSEERPAPAQPTAPGAVDPGRVFGAQARRDHGGGRPLLAPATPVDDTPGEADVTGGFYVYGQGGAVTYDSLALGFDTSLGLFGHIGFGPANGVPWAALLLGVERRREGGEPKGRESWTATGVWAGMAFPRASGVVVSLHHQSFDAMAAPVGKASATTVAVRKLFGGQRAYLAFGAETLMSSSRGDADDAFGPGPRFRMMVEVGIGGFGRGLVR